MNHPEEASEEKYSIIWYVPNFDSALKENKTLYFFSEFKEVVNFAQSLKVSFLIIVPNNFDDEQFKNFHKDFYGRRLADFEEEAILQELGISEPFDVYVFYTDDDFESEVFVEEDAMKWDVKEAAKGFREELIFWERKRRGLEVFERSEGSQRFSLLENLCDLWEFGEEEESFRESKRFCIRSLKRLVKKRKQEKKKLVYYVNLGECYFQLKDYEKALEYYTKVCDIVEQTYGESHPNIVNIYEGLARIYYRLEDFEKAIEYGLKIVEMRKSIDGEMHSTVASLYETLAYIYSCLKEHEKVAEYCLKAIEILKDNESGHLTDLYVKVLKAYQSLARLSFQRREYQKAIECNLKLIEIRKLIYGERHEKIVSSYQDLAMIYSTFGQYEKTIECYLKAIEIKESESGFSDFVVGLFYSRIGDAYKKLKDFPKALQFYQKNLKIKKCIYGETSRWAAYQYNMIGLIFKDIGEYQNARKYLEKALAIYKPLRKENPSDLDLCLETGDIRYALNRCQREIEEDVKIYDTNI